MRFTLIRCAYENRSCVENSTCVIINTNVCSQRKGKRMSKEREAQIVRMVASLSAEQKHIVIAYLRDLLEDQETSFRDQEISDVPF